MYKSIFTFVLFYLIHATGLSQVVIKMERSGGVSIIPCKVNGLKLNFVFDTGASDVSLSLKEANQMFKKGYLRKKDIIGTARYRDASGDISECYVVNLKVIEIARMKLFNIRAGIVKNMEAPLLLGQTAIGKLGKIQLDLKKNTLTILTKKKRHK